MDWRRTLLCLWVALLAVPVMFTSLAISMRQIQFGLKYSF